MTSTVLMFLSRWSGPHQVLRLGRKRLKGLLARQSRGQGGARQAEAILNAANATLKL